MKKQTAVDYLSSKVMAFNISSKEIRDFLCCFDQAKEMEKEQIQEAYWLGTINWESQKNAEEYYKENYGKDA